ncbi:protein phosphatase 2C domain-containing protein [Nonomuraea sp. NPDC048916]|uniref:protein phosphatase 2C domain-containing protein n=1 Tax=Nonomuraea sp. NPDC048916 TaxID=3154232 RepID=UPI0033DC03C8
MTFVVITILIACLPVMAVRGRRAAWPPGLPVPRPRLVAAGGTYEGSHGHPSDAYVVQERLIAVADGAGAPGLGQTAAALALSAVVAAGPQHTGPLEEDLEGCAQAAHRAVRAAAGRDPVMSGLVSTLDLIMLDPGESPRLCFVHLGNGAIWHCAKGETPQPLTTSHSFDGGPPPRGIGSASAPEPEVGTVSLRPGDRVVVVTDGVIQAVGVPRMTELFTVGSSPAACLDRLYDEMAAVEPKDDATVVIAEFVTV